MATDEDKEKKRLREEKKKRAATEKNLRNVEQYILSQNINVVRDFYNNKKGFFNYRTFRQINGASPDIVTTLRGTPDMTPFFGLNNAVLSLLQPKIKIFRVTYDEVVPAPGHSVADGESDVDRVAATSESTRVPLSIPCHREFKFSDNFGNENAASVESYLASESTKASWRNVGLDSFQFRQIGTSHGAIENNIECTLRLKLKSLKDFVAQPPGEPSPERGGLRYVDLVLHPGAQKDADSGVDNPMHYEIKVFLGYHAPTKEMINKIVNSNNISERQLLESLEKMNMILALNLRDYDFVIGDDGTTEVVARYWGRIDSSLNNGYANIFQETFVVGEKGNLIYSPKADIKNNYGALSRLSNKVLSIHKGLNTASCEGSPDCAAKKTLQELLKENELFKTIVKEEGAPATELNALYEWLKIADNANKLIGSLKSKASAFREQVYEGFMKQLIDGNPQPSGGNGTRLFCASASKKEVQAAVGLIDSARDRDKSDEDITLEEIRRNSSTAIGEAGKTLVIGRCNEIDMSSAESAAEVKESSALKIKNAISEESKSKDGDAEPGEESSKLKTIMDEPSEGQHPYYFLFLGDIIELACKNAGLRALDYGAIPPADPDDKVMPNPGSHVYVPSSYIKGNIALDYGLTGIRFLLGPLEYYDSTSNLQRINLAQFPIAFDLFMDWFLHTIVKKNRIKIPVGSFITKLLNQLVMPALSADFIRAVKPTGTRTESISLTLPGRQVGGKYSVCGREASRAEELLPVLPELNISSDAMIAYSDKARQSVSDETKVKTSFDYWLVQVSTRKDITLRSGRAQEDIKDGIYHFNIGSDRGLLKNMRFTKSALQGMSEWRSFQAISGGNDQLAQLREVYDCNIELIGNTLFTPGMLFYANASLIGLGDPASAGSLAYQLNLGGYFAIMNTEMSIRPGQFETRLTGKQVGFGKKREL